MKKQTVMLLGLLMVSSFAQAQRARHIRQPRGNCVLSERTRCNLQIFNSDADFSRARLVKSQFERAEFLGNSGKRFNMKSSDMRGADFKGAAFTYVIAVDTKVTNARFDGAKLNNVNFSLSEGRGANFTSAQMIGLEFKSSKFENSNFSGINANGWEVSEQSDFYNTDFDKATLKNMHFKDVDLRESTFKNATIEDSYFRDSNLEGSDFTCSVFKGVVEFKDSKLNQINFTAADLSNANFDGATERLLEGHYCGTRLSNGQYRSTEAGCSITDGQSPAAGFCP